MRRRAPRIEEMRRLLVRRRREGLTYAEVAKVAGISPSTVSWWAWRLRRGQGRDEAAPPIDFVEVVSPEGADETRVEIVLARGRRVLVPPSIDSDALLRIIEALERC